MTDPFAELKKLISHSGLSLQQIAKRADCHVSTIDHWLSGRVRNPRIRTVARVAAVLGKRLELGDGELAIVPAAAKRAPRMALWRWR